MESYQPPHHYMRPPPPPPPPWPPASVAGDPHMPHHPPSTGSWFSGQFHYHPSHSPSAPPPHPQQLPPPPQQNQWAPTPPPSHAHPNAPYPAQQPYPPPPPPPLPPPPAHHAYPPVNQDWGNANWSHHPGREYPGHNNEEDWAARARAWASARSAMESQHPQSQLSPMARPDEPSHYSNQHSQPVESHYQHIQHTSVPASGFQNYHTPVAPLTRPPLANLQEPASISSYAPDGHFSFTAKDGAPGGDINAAFPHQQGSASSSVRQQEVPSSYSSIPGNEEGSEGWQHGHSLPDDGRAMAIEQAQFPYSNLSLDPMDQPLEFAPRFSHENDQKMRSGFPDSSAAIRGADAIGFMSSLHPWTASAAPGGSYPPAAFPSAPKHDSSMGVSPFPGQPPAPMFERDQSFRPTAPSITGPVGLGAGTALHPSAAFPVDAYGTSLSSERLKKAAVPNWLREEIIKNKATITSSVSEQLKEGTQSFEDEMLDNSTGKGDLVDSKSMDSSKSTEEEDDEEDQEEAQRIAAINQEIKRVLTEVLLKVTDELFDEIATKVLNADDVTADAMPDPNSSVPKNLSPPPTPVPAPKASSKVLVSVKPKESVSENPSTESSSGSPGNVLGLANYASDDDDDDENLTSRVPKAKNDAPHGAVENGHQLIEAEKHSRSLVSTEGDHGNRSSVVVDDGCSASAFKLNDHRIADKDLDSNVAHQAYSRSADALGKKCDDVSDDRRSVITSDAAKSMDAIGKATANDADIPAERHNSRKSNEHDQERDARRHDKHENRRDTSGKDVNCVNKEVESSKEREDEKVDSRGKRDERHRKKEKAEDHDTTKERSKEHHGKDREKTRDSDSRKKSPHHNGKERKKERESDKKTSGRDDADRKRERTKDEKDDRSRHKSSSRHKRRRSSSVGRRSKQSKGSPVVSDGSSDEASQDSRRKANTTRRDFSPSPVRSRQRQVLRSPHSKHSQRRHSPFFSLDGSREKRSRSRSPVRRHR